MNTFKAGKDQEILDYLNQYAGYKTPVEMAIELGISKNALICRANKWKISLKIKSKVESIKNVNNLIDQYHKIKSVNEIAELAGVPPYIIRVRGRTRGIKFFSYKPQYQKVENDESNNLYFNEDARENWLI